MFCYLFLWVLCRGVIPCARFIYVCAVVSVGRWDGLPVVVSSLCAVSRCRMVSLWDVLPVDVEPVRVWDVPPVDVNWWPWSVLSTPCQPVRVCRGGVGW